MSFPLITAVELTRLEHVLICDCRFDLYDPSAGQYAYQQGHIPGAQYLDLEKDLSGPSTGTNGRHPLPDRAVLSEKLRQIGLGQTQTMVVYDAQGGMFAARAWWLLRWLGHNNVRVLDGGLQSWLDAKLPLAKALTPISRGNFQALAEPMMATVDSQVLLQQLDNPQWQIIDARSPDRFRGENAALDKVTGHIPGATNRYFRDNLTDQGYFKTAAQLRDEYHHLLKPQALIVHQCGSGVSACHNLLSMEIAGLPVGKLYPGSWSEWSADASRPIAQGS